MLVEHLILLCCYARAVRQADLDPLTLAHPGMNSVSMGLDSVFDRLWTVKGPGYFDRRISTTDSFTGPKSFCGETSRQFQRVLRIMRRRLTSSYAVLY